MGKFTIFDFLKVRHDLEVIGQLKAPAISVPGVEKTVKSSEIKYNTSGIGTKASVGITLPKGAIVTKVVADVTQAFNAATTNVLTLGYSSDTDALMAAADITEGTIGAYVKQRMDAPLGSASVVYAQYTQTGTAATAGKATFYVTYIESL